MLTYVIVGIVIGIVISRLLPREPGAAKEFPKGRGATGSSNSSASSSRSDAYPSSDFSPPSPPPAQNKRPAPGSPTMEDILATARAGNKIQAIKLYRELHGVGLKEAKEAVEELSGER